MAENIIRMANITDEQNKKRCKHMFDEQNGK